MLLYDRTGRDAALAEADTQTAAALRAARDDDPDLAECLDARSIVLRAQAARTGDIDMALDAVSLAARAVEGTPEPDPDRAAFLAGHGLALSTAFRLSGRVSLLDKQVRVFREAVTYHKKGPGQAAMLSNLANALTELAQFPGQPTALDEALGLRREALALVPAGHPDLPGYQSDLAGTLIESFQRSGQVSQLREASELARLAVDATPPGHPQLAGYETNLGAALQLRYEHDAAADSSKVVALLDEQLSAARRALTAAPASRAERAACLANLSVALGINYQRTGSMEQLLEAVTTGRDAAETVTDGDIHKPVYLQALASVLSLLARATGDSGLLIEAISALRGAGTLLPRGHWQYAGIQANLANAWYEMFLRSGETGHLRAAAECGREALAARSATSADRTQIVGNLIQALRELAMRTGDRVLLNEAGDHAKAALLAMASTHVGRPRLLMNHAATLRAAYFALRDSAEPLGEAVRLSREALAVLGPDHLDRADFLFDAGYTLTLIGAAGSSDAWREAAGYLSEAARTQTASARVRISALGLLARRPPESGGSIAQANSVLEEAVRLLPQAVPRGLTRADRERGVRDLAGFPAMAAAAAVLAGDPVRAVELLEQSRGILVADTLAARSGDLGRLRSAAPGLAAEFAEASSQLAEFERGGRLDLGFAAGQAAGFDGTSASAIAAKGRARAATAWQAVLDRIRAVAGLEDFLLPKRIEYLSAAAAEGPVVYVYASQLGCDALILTGHQAEPVTQVPLPGLSMAEAERQVQRLISACAAISEGDTPIAGLLAAHAAIAEILGWAWDVIAGPVLAALRPVVGPAGQPRLWWCPVGLLAFLPLHAAGHHAARADGTGAPPTVMDQVVSSYTATARALIHARAARDDSRPVSTLIVCASDVPGTPSLPGARAEAEDLRAKLPGARLLDRPSCRDVLAALPANRTAHFACHGQANPADPASGQLIVHDHAADPLTVELIAGLDLAGAELAYLSACETTVTSQALSDEAVHLTAAFQLAGYRRVVGTLWAADDRAARRLTHSFYARLTGGFVMPPRAEETARALHEAVLKERAAVGVRGAARWAAHVHFGV